MNCGMKLFIRIHTSTVQPLNFVKGNHRASNAETAREWMLNYIT